MDSLVELDFWPSQNIVLAIRLLIAIAITPILVAVVGSQRFVNQ
ncbi:hypothetical protein DSUL_50380 [Desulfovibrionales bacterium]